MTTALAEPEWDTLPDATAAPDLTPAPVTEDATGDAPICPVCDLPIFREPGARGRLPKKHKDCATRTASTGTTRSSTASRAKAEREADLIVAGLQQQITRACIMLSVVDKFDAFVVMVSLPQLSANLRGVLISYDKLRKDMLAMQSGGSIFGLVLSIVMMLLPMAAHHGFLGRGNAAKMLVELPFTLLKINERLKEGTETLTNMMAEQMQAAKAANESKATANGAT